MVTANRSHILRMETNGSIVRTNNVSLESYYTNLKDMIDLYSDEAKGDAQKPREGWASDYGRYLALRVCIIVK